jgi:hypothetical protein
MGSAERSGAESHFAAIVQDPAISAALLPHLSF